MKVTLGDTVKDPITGIKGIALSYITYLHGCERVGIQQPAFKNEKGETAVPDLFYVDDPQCDIIKKVKPLKKTSISKGGPSGFDSLHKHKV